MTTTSMNKVFDKQTNIFLAVLASIAVLVVASNLLFSADRKSTRLKSSR